jgi:hypothetical protein
VGSSEARALAAAPARSSGAPSARASALPSLDADGCATDFVPGASAVDSVIALARHCAVGMRALKPAPESAALHAGERREFTFTVDDTSRCVRVLAAFGAALRDVELELLDAEGRAYGRISAQRSFALLGPNGPLCVAQAGTVRVAARAQAGSGQAALQLYQVE